MKVLILSCNTGEGHNSCGTSLLESFKIRNIPCEMVDALGFISPLVSRTVSYGFTRIYRYVPSLFGRGYSYAEEHDSRLFSEKSPVYRLITIGADKLYEYIKNSGYDTIICPHVFTALMMTEILRRHDISVKTCYISTDYTCSPSCGDSELDMYFIPDESLRKEFVGCGVPDEKIIASGIPVRHEFAETLGKAEARRYLGLPKDCRHLLVMSGSMGCGPIKKLSGMIAEALTENAHISVICGTNRSLIRKLQRECRGMENVHIYGFRRDIPVFMDSADLLMTKPGGLSTSEAAGKRLPMILVNTVQGCETHNLKFFEDIGAAVTADSIEKLAALAIALLSDEARLKKMSDAFGEPLSISAAETVVRWLTGESPSGTKKDI